MDAIQKRKLIVACTTGVILFNVLVIVFVLLSGTSGPEIDAAKIITAVNAYRQQLISSRQPIPKSVTAAELVHRHLLSSKAIAGFGSGEVVISMNPNHLSPSEPMIRVRQPDGHEISILADGSVRDAKP